MSFQIVKLKQKKMPMFNGAWNGLSLDSGSRYISQGIIKRIKITPELIGLLDTIVTDHFMGQIDFFDTNGKLLGPTKLKKVKKFWAKNKVKQSFQGQGMDYFIDGSSFGWHQTAFSMMNAKQKEAIIKIKEFNEYLGTEVLEDANTPLEISYLAASTTEIKHDANRIISYVQEANGVRNEWNPENIVHIKLIEFNGEVRGFSGLKSLVKEIAMMYMLKENILASLENGGSPDNIISLVNKNGVGYSKARFERMRTALESFSHLRKSHGNLPIDAEIAVHRLGAELKDMEYRELAMFALSEFALALGIPTSRIPFLMTGSGGNANKGEMSSNTEDSYQNKINNRRETWEMCWNEVFEKAGFTFKFRRSNIMDEVKETQAATQRSAYVQSVQSILRDSKKKLKPDVLMELLSGTRKQITVNDTEEMTEEDMVPNSPIGVNQNDMKANIPKDNKISEVRSQFHTKVASNNGVHA